MHYPDEALEQLQKVIKLDPKNKDARTYSNIAKKKIAEYRVREKKIYGKFMFLNLHGDKCGFFICFCIVNALFIALFKDFCGTNIAK